jgi:hypothetical protein
MNPGYARLAEQREEPYWRIHDFHIIDNLALIPAKFEADRFVSFDEINFAVWTVTYEVEALKGCEPEIIGITAERFDGAGTQTQTLKGATFELARAYLQDDHDRWTAMRDWLFSEGTRDPVKEAA